MKPILLLDIDSTLLNTHELFQRYIRPAIIQYLGVTWEDYKIAEDDYRTTLEKSTDFHPEEYTANIATKFQVDLEAIRAFFATEQWYRQSIYEDVTQELPKLKEHYQLGLYSEGHDFFQWQKVELGGLTKWFDPELIYIHRRKTAPEVLERLPESSILIDDKPEYVEAFSRDRQRIGVWLNRKSGEKHSTLQTIGNFHDFWNIQK